VYFNGERSDYVQRLRQPRTWGRTIVDRMALPWIACVSDDRALRKGLTPIDLERFRAAWPWIQGRLLDVGCGDNLLVEAYGDGIGADVVDWGQVDVLLPDDGSLPFEDGSFDTVTLLASLNHIAFRERMLTECRRVLRPGGRLVATMLNPWVSYIIHRLRRELDPDQTHRLNDAREVWGLWPQTMRRLIKDAGFVDIQTRTFVLGLNRVYVAHAPRLGSEALSNPQSRARGER
jgi:SAM-dependent methyltransferase